MNHRLMDYEPIVGHASIRQLMQLGSRLAGLRMVQVNSTKEGGGVAEILSWMTPLMREIGVESSWEVITGPPRFYEITKALHNGLQGQPVFISQADWKLYREVNAEWAERSRAEKAAAEKAL